MTLSEMLLLASICLAAMVSPGPDFLLVTKNSLLLSRRHAFATAFGVVAGCLFHAAYCTLGLAILITQSVLLFSLVKYAGACYLIYLGIKGLLARPAPADGDPDSAPVPDISVRGAFLQGLLCNLLNPKLAVFLLSLFTQFIAVDAPLVHKAAVAGVFATEALLYWPLLVVLLQAGAVQRSFRSVQHLVDRTCGALLVAAGVKVAVTK